MQKPLTFIMCVLCLLAAANKVGAGAYKVIESGFAIVDGVYTEEGQCPSRNLSVGERPYYHKSGTDLYIGYRGCEGGIAKWIIGKSSSFSCDIFTEVGPVGDYYSRNSSDEDAPPYEGWVNKDGASYCLGVEPCPNPKVVPVTSFVVNSAEIIDVNGEYYDTGRTFNGRAVYQKGVYRLGYRNCSGGIKWAMVDGDSDANLVCGNTANLLFGHFVDSGVPPATGWQNSTGSNSTLIISPYAPSTVRASNLQPNGFTARWHANSSVLGYRLDVTRDEAFSEYVAGYQDLDVGNTTSWDITENITGDTQYFYRVRAYNPEYTSANANVQRLRTPPVACEVSGGADEAVNGSYTYWGMYQTTETYGLYTVQEMPVYKKVGTNYYLGYRGYFPMWVILELPEGPDGETDSISSGCGTGTAYGNNTDSMTPPVTGWDNQGLCGDPGPYPIVISSKTFGLSGAGTQAANGIYVDTGRTFNGRPVYEKGPHRIGYSDCPAGPKWVLVETDYDQDLTCGSGASPLYGSDDVGMTPQPSGWYADEGATPVPVLTPSPPIVVSFNNVGDDSLVMQWINAYEVIPATGYRLTMALDNAFTEPLVGYDNLDVGMVDSYSISGLSPRTIYYFRISAYNALGAGPWSTTLDLETAPSMCEVIGAGTTAANGSYTFGQRYFTERAVYEMGLYRIGFQGYSWVIADGDDDNFIGDYSHQLYYRSGYGTWIPPISDWRIHYGTGESPAPTLTLYPPQQPSGLHATGLGTTGFTLNWSASIGADSYRVDIADDPGFSNILPGYADVITSGMSLSASGLYPYTTYYARVRAEAGGYTSGSSARLAVTTAEPVTATVLTGSVSGVTATTATGSGQITALGDPLPSQHGVVWDVNPNPSIALSTRTEEGPRLTTGQFTSEMTGLTPGTQYYVRAYATNGGESAYGANVGFATAATAADVTTGDVTDIGLSSATLLGSVTELSIPAPAHHGFVWDTAPDPTIDFATRVDLGPVSAIGDFTYELNDLQPYTAYYVRAYTVTVTPQGDEVAYGNQKSFQTLALPPTVSTHPVTDITAASAMFHGNITQLSIPQPVSHGFVWDTSPNPTVALTTKTDYGQAVLSGAFSGEISALSDATIYYVRAYATYQPGEEISVYGGDVAFTTLGIPPAITSDPVSVARLEGQSVVMAVVATGTAPLSYQWRKDGVDLPGATEADISLASVTISDAGQYDCVVTNLFGFATSNSATLSISQLVDVYEVFGAGVAGVNGYYQDSGRLYNGLPVYEKPGYILGFRGCSRGGSTWVIINSSNDEDLEGVGDNLSVAPLYRNDTAGDTPPATGWVAVHDAIVFTGVPFVNQVMPPAIVEQPQSLSTQIGTTVSFSVSVTGGTPLSYQWQKDGIDMDGETDSSLTISPVAAEDVGAYTCKVSNRTGTISSEAAHLFIGETLTILMQPESQTITPGESVTFSISAFGSEPLFYQWRKNGADIAGATGTVYSIAAVSGSDVGENTIVVSNDFGAVESAAAVLTVPGPAFIEDQPDSQVKYLGQSVTFGVTASGTQPINYQWLKDGAAIDGADAATLTLADLLLSDAGDYTCTVDNGLGQDESDAATLEVYANDAPAITGQTPDPLTTARAMPFTILLQNLVVADANDNYPDGFTLNVMAGEGYTVAGHEVTPQEDFEGDELQVPVSVHDGTDESDIYLLSVTVNAVEPVIAELYDGPASVTNAESYALTVGGAGVAAYKYRLDSGAWSLPADVDAPLAFTLGEGYHQLEVVGCDTLGHWQSPNRATAIHWTIDTTPPEAVLTNTPVGTVGTTSVHATVGGADVRYFRYRLDDEDWGAVVPVEQPLVITGLEEGQHTLAVIGLDTAGNWAGAPAAQGAASWVIDPTVPTAILSNLPESVTAETTADITVGWEADAPVVDHYKYSLDSGVTWHLGQGPTIELDDDLLDEGVNTIFVNAYNLAQDRWQDGDVGESTASATAFTWRIDLTAPEAPVLSAGNSLPAATAAALLWSATESGLQGFRLYVADHAFDAASLDAVDTYYVGMDPGPEGRVAAFRAAGLSPGTTYYFGVTAADKAGNRSGLSNIAVCTTADILPRIMTVGLAGGGAAGDNSVARPLVVSGVNFMQGDGNVVRFSCPPRTFELPGTSDDGRSMTVEVPAGAPVGIYRLTAVNTNGISRDCTSTYTVLPAPVKPPEVLDVQPATITADANASIVITGSHFVVRDLPAHAVALIDADGRIVTLDVFDVQHSEKIAAMIPSGLLARGLYGIGVTTVSGSNEVSAARLEVVAPIDVSVAGAGSRVSSQGIDMSLLGGGDTAEGTLPAAITLKTPAGDNTGDPVPGRLKISATFAPGTRIFYDDGTTPPRSFDGVINPPRQIVMTTALAETIARPAHAAVFQLGSSYPLMLDQGQAAFVRIEIALPDTAYFPLVYVLTPEGAIQPAGIHGAWQGEVLEPGGTILAERQGQPEEGYTVYTVGLLLDHLSTFIVGTSRTEEAQSTDPPFSVGGDSGVAVGCFVESAGER